MGEGAGMLTVRYLAPSRSRSWTNFQQSKETAIANMPSLKALPWG